MLAATGLVCLEKREEIPSCLVHLLRVGLWSFFSKLRHNPKMETADSKGILSVYQWRGGGQQQIEEHPHRNVPKDTETITQKQLNSWGTETASPGSEVVNPQCCSDL